MVTKAIYSYKILKNYWKERTEDFFSLAKLSVNSASKHYKTVLYCDGYTEKVFKDRGIFFDEYINLPALGSVTENTYGLAKVYAMLEQTEPYVILDLDTVILEPLDSLHTITFAYKEAEAQKLPGKEYIDKYYYQSYLNFKEDISIDLDWSIFPNNSIVFVKNPYIVAQALTDSLNTINNRYIISTVQFYEQFLFYNFLKSYQTDIGFFYDVTPLGEQLENYTLQKALSKKFLHLDYYYRLDICQALIKELEKKLLR